MRWIATLALALLFIRSFGQVVDQDRIEAWADDSFLEGIATLREFLMLPNYGGVQSHIDQNLAWCESAFEALQFETTVLVSAGVKHLFAERTYRPGAPTILFYLQVDGQPVDSSEWLQPNPYRAVLKECIADTCQIIDWSNLEGGDWNSDWKVFARSVSDSKGPAVAFLQSLRILHQQQIAPAFNIKVIMDFQEELGSPTLPALVNAKREDFAADVMLIMDGTRPPGNTPTLTFGARGIATLKLTVFGAKKDLHSGQYGNYAPNPVFSLARLLASMKDENGRVQIPGYYDGILLTEQQKKLINQVPEDKEQLLGTLGISEAELIGETYQESLQYPSLNVRGLRAAWVGEEVRTIIPSEALAEIDMRLVPETPAERQIELVRKHIEAQGFKIIDDVPTDEERKQHPKLIRFTSSIGSRPFRTPLDSPLGDWLGLAMDKTFGSGAYVRMQATGGSQPIAPFITTLELPAVSVRIPNPYNSIHAPNENLRLGNFHEGIRMCLGILTQPYE